MPFKVEAVQAAAELRAAETEKMLDENGPMFSPGTVRYWYQDGASFTMFSHREDAHVGGESMMGEISQCTYPHPVKDCDMVAAAAARQWFLKDWCLRNNVTPYEA